ncbi:MAG: AraC family transcriptional regulator [Mobilitalea sp.]
MSIVDDSSSLKQRDFWNNLQNDLLAPSQNSSKDEFLTILERSIMFSLFFRGCQANEIMVFQQKLNIKPYAYVILLELADSISITPENYTINEFELHQLIKQVLSYKNCVVGPLLTRRVILLISDDTLLTEEDHRKESHQIYQDLYDFIKEKYQVKTNVGVGGIYSLFSIFSSYLDALTCIYHNETLCYSYYLDWKKERTTADFDYHIAENHLIEAVRLHKPDAYSYFGLLMSELNNLSIEAKRSKIIELLVLTHHALGLDNQNDVISLEYIRILTDMMLCSPEKLVDYAYQQFYYITSYTKPQKAIDYTNDIVKAAKEYLEEHYADDITLEAMADHVNISPHYFSKLLKKNTGFNYIDWLSMLRVRKAKELLLNPNLTVSEVCFMVGYKDPNYFSRIFKKRIGITPSEYVKANSFINNMN